MPIKINRNTYFCWIVVCALAPFFRIVNHTAIGKVILPTDPHSQAISLCIGILIFISAFAPPILQWAVLQQIAPRLKIWIWFLIALLVGVTSIVFVLCFQNLGEASRHFASTAWYVKAENGLTWVDLLHLPWVHLIGSTILSNSVIMLVPAIVLGRASGARWYVFLIAAIAGACAFEILNQLYMLSTDQMVMDDEYALNGTNWLARIYAVSALASIGAIEGAVNGMIIALILRRIHKAFELRVPMIFLLLTIGMAGAVIASISLLGNDGGKINLASLRRNFSLFGTNDVSEGETILQFSHKASIRAPKYTTIHFTTDSRYFLTETADRTLTNIDSATGKSLGPITESFRPHDQTMQAWSSDGRYLALLTDGGEVKIQNTIYTLRRSRVRLYAPPLQQVMSENEPVGEECLRSSEWNSMMFESDNKSLWLACGQYSAPGTTDVMAVKLAIPTLMVMEIRRYGAAWDSGKIRAFAMVGGSVYAWQHAIGKIDNLRLLDLTHDRAILSFTNLNRPGLADDLTSQSTFERIDGAKLVLPYCGFNTANTVIPDLTKTEKGLMSGPWSCRELSFDIRSGQFLESKPVANDLKAGDEPQSQLNQVKYSQEDCPLKIARAIISTNTENQRRGNTPCRTAVFGLHFGAEQVRGQETGSSGNNVLSDQRSLDNLRVKVIWHEDSDRGETTVTDPVSGKLIQRIATTAQVPLGVSPDGKWLVMNAFDEGILRVYRVRP